MRFLYIVLSLYSVFLSGEEIPAREPLALFLSWQEDPCTTMAIKWITPIEDTQTTLYYKKNQEKVWNKAEGTFTPFPNNVPYALHKIFLTHLSPKTSYSFHIGGYNVTHLFKTLPEDLSEPLSFIVGGDINLDNPLTCNQTTLKAATFDPAFICIGGDLACPSKKKEGPEDHQKWLLLFTNWYKTARHEGYLIPFIPVIGNHDVLLAKISSFEKESYYSFFFLEQEKKSFSVLRFRQYASLYLLDSGHVYTPGGDQADWLAKELVIDEKVLHRIAIYHVPAYPPVRSYRNSRCAAVRHAWPPLFDMYRLHLAFENHDHAYKRTHPLTGHEPDPHGVVYIGNGSWGVKARVPKKASQTLYLAKTAQARGFCLVQLSSEKREVFAVDYEGSVIDTFSQPTDPVAARERWMKNFSLWKKNHSPLGL